MSTIEKKDLVYAARLISKIAGETIPAQEIESIPMKKLPFAVLEAINAKDDSLADDVGMNEVRNVVVDEISRHVESKLSGRSHSVPYQEIPKNSKMYRIQETGYDSAIYYGNGTDGRYNHHRGEVNVMYAAEKPDTCLAEITERTADGKGEGATADNTKVQDSFFDDYDIGELEAQRDLKLLDVSMLGTTLKLSGQLTDNSNYRHTQAIVAAATNLGIVKDGFSYTSVHHGNGAAYALVENESNPQLNSLVVTKLSEHQVDAAELPSSEFTKQNKQVTMKAVMTEILGGEIYDEN
ncbi:MULTISPECIES: RES family NAD+ phosphorylase [unclassified Pseudoalteromonas]|uniref:RES family NAD+ phosphorylase n=1 Tax=unclassified Pseudoalteromonas TaxID=194690 RepID=UPI0005AB8028|nr:MULTISPECIES: RES family NAD+ phosphorylase [unclassified Pseudoalteromonas]